MGTRRLTDMLAQTQTHTHTRTLAHTAQLLLADLVSYRFPSPLPRHSLPGVCVWDAGIAVFVSDTIRSMVKLLAVNSHSFGASAACKMVSM